MKEAGRILLIFVATYNGQTDCRTRQRGVGINKGESIDEGKKTTSKTEFVRV